MDARPGRVGAAGLCACGFAGVCRCSLMVRAPVRDGVVQGREPLEAELGGGWQAPYGCGACFGGS